MPKPLKNIQRPFRDFFATNFMVLLFAEIYEQEGESAIIIGGR